MYTRAGLEVIQRYETYRSNGDSDFRYGSRAAFHAAHTPNEPLRIKVGRPVGTWVMFPNGNLVFFELWMPTPNFVWETDPITGEEIGYEPKALMARTHVAE